LHVAFDSYLLCNMIVREFAVTSFY
jgi:hypothetical protein